MNSRQNGRATSAALLTLALLLASCASSSPSLPVVPEKIRIPPPPAAVTPALSGTYWLAHCKLMQSAQDTLKRKLEMPALCSQLGPK